MTRALRGALILALITGAASAAEPQKQAVRLVVNGHFADDHNFTTTAVSMSVAAGGQAMAGKNTLGTGEVSSFAFAGPAAPLQDNHTSQQPSVYETQICLPDVCQLPLPAQD